MAKASSEKYLDNLLNSINGANVEEETSFEDAMANSSDDDFLRMFEAELESEDYSSFISDFELELEGKEKKKSTEELIMESPEVGEGELTLDEVLNRVEQHTEGVSSFDNSVKDDFEEDLSISSLEEFESAIGKFETTDNAQVNDLAGLEGLEIVGEPTGLSEIQEIGEPDLAGNGDVSLEDMLGGDLAELGDMLSMEGNVEDPEGDAFENYAKDEMSGASAGEGAQGKGKSKDKKKGGLFAKLAEILFGADDEDEEAGASSSDTADLSGLSEENAQILRDLEGEGASKPAKGKKGKEKKEKKAKPDKPKKAKPKKEKKPKEAKPKKEKKPKEKDNTPPLPKGPVIVIWIMALSLFALVMVGTKLIGDAVDMKSAKSMYTEGSYTKALQIIDGHSLKEEDEIFKSKIEVLAAIQSQMEFYNTFVTFDQPVDALDSIICAAGRCENYKDEAQALGITAEVDALKADIEKELKEMYGLSLDEVLEVYSIRDRNKYTIAVYKLCNRLGIKF